ncbi:MAG: zinc-binding dehydrogenase [Pirellulaceae bacterium]|nr:zinc-binding dehydrogenase [Pirellulaceae bacterium]
MRSSLAAVFHGVAGQLELCHIPVAAPGPGELLVRVLGCTLCGSDLHSFDGRRQVPAPTILGHEIVGRIEEFGPGAPRVDLQGLPLQAGDRVVWSLVAHCGDCFYCRRQLPQKCLRGVKYGHQRLETGRELTGGLAEYCVLVPGTRLVRLPDHLPLEVACPAGCATATSCAACEPLGHDLSGQTVLVLGAGLLGLTSCALARRRGAEHVVCCELRAERRERSLAFGATEAVGPEELAELMPRLNGGRGADAVLELTGSNAAFEAAWPLVRHGGRVVLVGAVYSSPPVGLILEQIVRRNLVLHGIHNYPPPHLAAAVEFLAEAGQRFPWSELVSQWFPLCEAAQAFAAAADPRHVRVGVRADSENLFA